jgi:hypothetical protein
MEQSLAKLCELRDIARDLQRNVRNSWLMILGPNITCSAGVFILGFGIGASVITNNIAALAALANGLLPMHRVARLEAERRIMLEMELGQSRICTRRLANATTGTRHRLAVGGRAERLGRRRRSVADGAHCRLTVP